MTGEGCVTRAAGRSTPRPTLLRSGPIYYPRPRCRRTGTGQMTVSGMSICLANRTTRLRLYCRGLEVTCMSGSKLNYCNRKNETNKRD
jgi:hypothetical protein